MCIITMEVNRKNVKFLVVNIILAKNEIFSLNDIDEEVKTKIKSEEVDFDVRYTIESCIEDLLENGIIYEIGDRYKVKNRQERWRRM